jgi:hypothetical protein
VIEKSDRFYFFVVIIFLILSITYLQYLKFYNYNINHYDTGVELHDTFQIYKKNFSRIFDGHFKIFKFILAPIFNLENIFLVVIIFFIIQTTIIIFPLVILKDFKIKIIYLLNPITWNFLLGDFHYDYFLIPSFFLIFHLAKSNNKYYFLTIFFGLIKEHFYIFPFITGIYLFYKYKKKIWLNLSLISIFFFLLTYFLIYKNFLFNFKSDSSILEEKLIYYSNANIYFFSLLLINFIILGYKFNKIFFLFFFFPFVLIYILFAIKGMRFGFISHYYLPFFLIFFQFYDKKIIKKYFNYRAIISLFLLITLSISPISIFFWIKDINFPFSKSRYYNKLDDDIYYKKFDFENKIIAISNNFLIPNSIKSKTLLSFGEKVDLNKVDYVFISKKGYSYDANFCKSLGSCFFSEQYQFKVLTLNDLFILEFESENYTVYRNKNLNN